MLAMVVNDYACLLVKRGALESIASKLAPTVFSAGVNLTLPTPPLTAACTSGSRSARFHEVEGGVHHARGDPFGNPRTQYGPPARL